MSKFSQEQIDWVKRELKIVDLAQGAGLELRRKNGQFVTCCPWHDDKEPSLFIHPEKNLFNCFGCDAGGDVIQWIMRTQKLDFSAVMQWAQENFSAFPGDESPAYPLDVQADDQELLHQVIEFYHQKLLQDNQAQDYLAKRGILDGEALKTFRIGFADRDLGRLLPSKQVKAGKQIRTQLMDVGVYRRQTGHGHFNGCIVFPVIDTENKVHEIYGRKITSSLRKGTDRHMYLPGDGRPFSGRGIWNERALAVHQEIILCESIIDALSFWVAGYRNVTAIYGTNGFTDDHLDALAKYKTKTVLLALDRDDEGEAAANRISKILLESGIGVYRCDFPRATKDANAYIQIAGKGYHGKMQSKSIHDWLGVIIRNATWLGQGEKPEMETEPGFLKEAREQIAGERRERAVQEEAAKEKMVATDSISQDGAQQREASGKAAIENASSDVVSSCLSSLAAGPAAPCSASEMGPVASLSKPSCDVATNGSGDSSGCGSTESPSALPTTESPSRLATEQGVSFTFGERTYRVRGLEKNLSYAVMKINLLVRRGENETFHIDTFDLYQARHRSSFIKQASIELSLEESILKREVGKILVQLEELQEQQITAELSPAPVQVELSSEEQHEALALLKDPQLLQRILDDFAACGVVGEENNKLIGYLAAVSRKLNDPLAVLIQSSSAAGKSSLMDAILSFVPEEDKVIYSAMTGQSLYYMGGGDLKHKILAISEEEGVRQASYALKLLQSEGSLRIASTGKDPNTGRMETQEYTVEGPVMLFLTTTSYEVDEELQNRCLTLSVCEDQQQTQAIHREQRKRQTLDGLLSQQNRQRIQQRHQNAQRLLRPLLVANNHAEGLTFRTDRTRTRRDHAKYLTLIRTIALLHQHQREIKTVERDGQTIEYIEAMQGDIHKADELASLVLARSYEELPERTQFVWDTVNEMLIGACQQQEIGSDEFRFTRRELRLVSGIGNTQLKLHLDRLEDLEYVVRLKRNGSNPTIVYAVIEIDPKTSHYDSSFTGEKGLLRGAFGGPPENGKPLKTPEKNGQLQGVV